MQLGMMRFLRPVVVEFIQASIRLKSGSQSFPDSPETMASMFKLSTSFQTRLDRKRNDDDSRDKICRFLKDDQRAAISHKLEKPPFQHPQRDETDTFQKRERLRQVHDLINDEDLWIPQPPDPRAEQEREQEMLRKVVQDSPELRELRAKLHLAEINRQRHQQLQEKQLMEMEESSRENAFYKLMEEQLERADKLEQERLCKLQKQKMETRMTMQEQLHEKELEKEREWERRVQEQKEMNKLIAKLNEEREAEAALKRKKQEEAITYISGYLESRAKEKENKVRRSREEEAEIARYQALQDQRLAEKAAKEREKKERNEKIHAMLAAGKEEETRQKEEYETMLNDLYFEEAEERYRKNAEEQRIQREQTKENLRACSEFDHYMKEQRKLKEKAEKEAFHKKMMDQMAHEHKLEQLNAQRQRMKTEEFKREIEKLWNEKKSMFHEQVDEAKERRKREEELQEKRKAVIEEERQRLLATQGKKLAKFLPKGVLESDEDYRLVGLKR